MNRKYAHPLKFLGKSTPWASCRGWHQKRWRQDVRKDSPQGLRKQKAHTSTQIPEPTPHTSCPCTIKVVYHKWLRKEEGKRGGKKGPVSLAIPLTTNKDISKQVALFLRRSRLGGDERQVTWEDWASDQISLIPKLLHNFSNQEFEVTGGAFWLTLQLSASP